MLPLTRPCLCLGQRTTQASTRASLWPKDVVVRAQSFSSFRPQSLAVATREGVGCNTVVSQFSRKGQPPASGCLVRPRVSHFPCETCGSRHGNPSRLRFFWGRCEGRQASNAPIDQFLFLPKTLSLLPSTPAHAHPRPTLYFHLSSSSRPFFFFFFFLLSTQSILPSSTYLVHLHTSVSTFPSFDVTLSLSRLSAILRDLLWLCIALLID